jgi:hypothetical protein
MSNLSELLPAGAGAKSASFVASGTLGSGVTVALNSDGTVSVVENSPEALGTAGVFSATATASAASAYDSASQKLIIAYRSEVSGDFTGYAIVGTVSGTSISFGSRVQFESNANQISCVFDSANNKVVIAYQALNSSQQGKAIVGTVSGTSISFGTAATFETGITAYTESTFDPVSGKVIIAYRDDGNSNYLQAVVATVSGTSISFGTIVVVSSVNNLYASIKYNSVNDKLILVYTDFSSSPYKGTAIVGTVSGTSTSWGSASAYTTGNGYYNDVAVDSDNGGCFISYRDNANSNYGTARIGTISGTSISFGTPVVYLSSQVSYNKAIYNTNSQKVVLAYTNSGSGDLGYLVTASISGTSISFDTPTLVNNNSTFNVAHTYITNTAQSVINYAVGAARNGDAKVFQTASSNNTDFIGITDQAIADTATGAVIVQGGVSDKVSSLTTGSDYYVQSNGTLSTTVSSVPAGRALSTTSILLEG